MANHQKVLLYNGKLREYIEETKQYILMRISSFKTFTKDQIAESQQLCEKLESCENVVDELRMDTHEWMPIEYQTLSLRPDQIPSETSSLERRLGEERKVATVYRCKRCGADKKVGSDGIS